MKQLRLLTAIYIIAAILLAAYSFHTVYAHHPPLGQWVGTIIYGFGPWACAFAFAGAKMCFQILLRKETKGFRKTFTWVTGVVIGLMIFTKIMA